MEINPNKWVSEMFSDNDSIVNDLIASIPGIDEAISFAELMKHIKKLQYDVIVFDTAPTGHTLKFLGFPSVLEKGIQKILELRNRFSGLISQVKTLMGGNSDDKDPQQVLSNLEDIKSVVESVNKQFKNHELTSFVCVCIPEFLSVYETSRLIESLDKFEIACEAIVVNQVLFPEKNSNCRKCLSRMKMQKKYLLEINQLFDEMSIITTPLMDEEVRGVPLIKAFSNFLVQPYEPSKE